MGKFSKKMKNKMNKQKQQQTVSNANSLSANDPSVAPIRAEVTRLKNEGQYMEALQEIIKLFEKGYTATEIIYEAAELYYLMGDYERTIVWGEKTLTFDNKYALALMLLAKTYMMENQKDKCFEKLNELLVVSGDIDAETQESIKDIMLVFEGEFEPAAIAQQYPLLAQYVNADKNNEAEDAAQEEPAAKSEEIHVPEVPKTESLPEQMGSKLDELKKSMQEKLQQLKEKQSTFKQEVPEKAAEAVAAVSEVHEAVKDNVQDKLGNLRASMQEKLQKLKTDTVDKLPQPAEVKETVVEAADKLKQTKETIANAVVEQTKTIATGFIADREIKEIMERRVSLFKKIDLLNQQGAILHLAGQSEAAIKMLQAVLDIDDTNEIANKNLGFIYAEAGNLQAANDYFAKLMNRDLMLENYLKNK